MVLMPSALIFSCILAWSVTSFDAILNAGQCIVRDFSLVFCPANLLYLL